LLNSGLAVEKGVLELRLPANEQALYGEAVKRRHKALAGALGLAV
jgi:hypothetical protein